MGHILRNLAKKEINKSSMHYPRFLSIERCEDFHIHWRNLRIELSQQEFEQFCQGIYLAYFNWNKRGRLPPEPDKDWKSINPDYLYIIPDIGYETQKYPTRIVIEEQKVPDWKKAITPTWIHLHYKCFRFDLSKEEFLELAEVIEEAKNKLIKKKDDLK